MNDSRPKRVSLAEIVHALFGAEGRGVEPSRGDIRIPVHAADGLRTLGVSLANLGRPAASPRRARRPGT
jgi:hypothetical protein